MPFSVPLLELCLRPSNRELLLLMVRCRAGVSAYAMQLSENFHSCGSRQTREILSHLS